MSTFDEGIAQTEAELAGLKGPARVGPLTRLGAGLMQRFTRTGPATPSGLADLDGAINALSEAHGLLPEGDHARAQVSFTLGMLLNGRIGYLGEKKDRGEAIERFEEGLASPTLPKVAAASGKVMLGLLYVFRALDALQDPAALASRFMNGRTASVDDSDVDRGAALFREVTAGPSVSDDLVELAAVGLEIADALKSMFGNGTGQVNLPGLMQAMGKFQGLQQKLQTDVRPGYGLHGLADVFDFRDLGEISRDSEIDRPVMVVEQTDLVAEPVGTPSRPQESASPRPTASSLRTRLHAALSSSRSGTPVWETAAALLEPDASGLSADTVDDLVAMADTVVELDGTEPEDAAVDRFLLAVGLRLRGRLADDAVDLRTALDALLTAARTVSPEHSAAPTIVSTLGAFLDPKRPLGGLEGEVAAGFAGRIDAILAMNPLDGDPLVRDGLHLLRCLCRAAWATAELARAIDTASAEIPWLSTVRAGLRSE